MDIIKVVSERRSIRKYRNDPVPDEVLFQILEAARQAPSWANTQTPRFVVIKDAAIKEALAETLTATNPARKAMIDAPCVICVLGEKGISGYYKGTPATDKGDWLLFDAGIAMEHVVLAAWNFGLGTVHVGLFNHKAAQDILRVPDGFEVIALTPLGYFDDTPSARPRRALEETVSLNVYGNPFKA
jgi:nitroreductase